MPYQKRSSTTAVPRAIVAAGSFSTITDLEHPHRAATSQFMADSGARNEDAAGVHANGSDHAESPKAPITISEVAVSAPAARSLARLLGRLAAVEQFSRQVGEL
jgi:hypothetical protein